jgi:hypothetical protein
LKLPTLVSVFFYSPSSLRLVEHLLRAAIKVNPLIRDQSSISSPLSFSTSEYPQHQAPAYSNLNFKFQGSAHVRRPRAEGHSDCDRAGPGSSIHEEAQGPAPGDGGPGSGGRRWTPGQWTAGSGAFKFGQRAARESRMRIRLRRMCRWRRRPQARAARPTNFDPIYYAFLHLI